jgi:hypothetical protein
MDPSTRNTGKSARVKKDVSLGIGPDRDAIGADAGDYALAGKSAQSLANV